MKVNKNMILVIFIVLFFVVITYFIEPVDSNVSSGESNHINDLEKENAQLKQDIESLEESLFKAEKFLFDSDLASDYLDYLPFQKTEILYKKIEDTKYVILFMNDVDKYLAIALDEPHLDIFLTIPSLNPTNGITMDYLGNSEYNYFGGIITDKNIKKVQVLQDTKVHKANIFKMEDGIYGWYSIFENVSGVSRDSPPDNMRIKAFDENDAILWQESF
ncbi:hypothetical protein EU245_14555 [Lentibacillus lipolyticus]|nr:hypothetical protein EU245_14555 [Lentibacillus lipolyticus]